jgi:hypothetical protein
MGVFIDVYFFSNFVFLDSSIPSRLCFSFQYAYKMTTGQRYHPLKTLGDPKKPGRPRVRVGLVAKILRDLEYQSEII